MTAGGRAGLVFAGTIFGLCLGAATGFALAGHERRLEMRRHASAMRARVNVTASEMAERVGELPAEIRERGSERIERAVRGAAAAFDDALDPLDDPEDFPDAAGPTETGTRTDRERARDEVAGPGGDAPEQDDRAGSEHASRGDG